MLETLAAPSYFSSATELHASEIHTQQLFAQHKELLATLYFVE
mgnify:CR=1 FL=1